MSAVDVAVREVRQVLAAAETAPEWRWNAHRRLTAASAALAEPPASSGESPVIPAQREADAPDADVQHRLDALASDVLDRLDVPTVQRELEGVLLDLERLQQRGS
jgi:hypothetical protein